MALAATASTPVKLTASQKRRPDDVFLRMIEEAKTKKDGSQISGGAVAKAVSTDKPEKAAVDPLPKSISSSMKMGSVVRPVLEPSAWEKREMLQGEAVEAEGKLSLFPSGEERYVVLSRTRMAVLRMEQERWRRDCAAENPSFLVCALADERLVQVVIVDGSTRTTQLWQLDPSVKRTWLGAIRSQWFRSIGVGQKDSALSWAGVASSGSAGFASATPRPPSSLHSSTSSIVLTSAASSPRVQSALIPSPSFSPSTTTAPTPSVQEFQIATLMERVAELEAARATLAGQVQKAEAEALTLRTDLAVKQRAPAKQGTVQDNKRLLLLMEESSQLSQALKASRDEKALLQSYYDSTNLQLQRKAHECTTLLAEVEQLKTQLATAQAAVTQASPKSKLLPQHSSNALPSPSGSRVDKDKEERRNYRSSGGFSKVSDAVVQPANQLPLTQSRKKEEKKEEKVLEKSVTIAKAVDDKGDKGSSIARIATDDKLEKKDKKDKKDKGKKDKDKEKDKKEKEKRKSGKSRTPLTHASTLSSLPRPSPAPAPTAPPLSASSRSRSTVVSTNKERRRSVSRLERETVAREESGGSGIRPRSNSQSADRKNDQIARPSGLL